VEKSVAASVCEVFHGIFLASKRRQRWSWKDSAEELFGMVAALLFTHIRTVEWYVLTWVKSLE